MKEATTESIIEVREEFMVSPSGDSVPTFRTAHFLKPIANSIDESQVSGFFQPNKWPLPFRLNSGWGYKSKKWIEWVDTLNPKFESLWKKVGIFDAIMNTKYYIIKNEDLAIGVAEKWFSKTNTFLFPWGEATITLEDVMVLGGFSIVGDPVFTPLEDKEVKVIEEQLLIARQEPWKNNRCKATASEWMKIFINSGSQIEHEAFLTTWLSMFVFPYKGLINKDVFPIAIHLARGNTIALAPAVLAGVYKDLGCMRETIVYLAKKAVVAEIDLEVILQSPFYLVQIWVWERFRNLQPQPNLINKGDPVLAKWHKVKALKVDNVRFCLNLAIEDFVWRPYVRNAAKWRIFYPENEMWLLDFEKDLDKELLSFVTCLRSSELVGIDYSIKQYLPHRVSMQFGMDQDVPGCVPRFNQTKAIAWENYCRPICDENLSIPSRLFEADVTTGYVRWWKQSVFDHPVKKIVRRKRSARRFSNLESHATKANKSGNDADAPPGFPPKLVSTSISGKRYGDASMTRKGDSEAHVPSGCLPKHLKTVTFRNFVLDGLVANDHHDADIPTAYSSDHGVVEKILQPAKIYENDNIKGSIEGLKEEFEDAIGSKESRLSTERASLSGTKDEDNSDSSKTNAEELEHRINKLEANFEQRIKKLERETTKLMKARRFGHT
ncbi:unnamed protein product [Lupinus luteus]|uniref:Aminotransferase-like plant mobile domain-containing protein n=1 Tax=Lupinus luteus TaxID=3873 RepID=A0AAV1VRA0_LUPLU